MSDKNLTLEEKIDLLLEYQEKAHRNARVRLIISLCFLLILIAIPILFYLWAGIYIQETLGIDPESLKESLDKIENLTEQLPANLFIN